MVLENSDALVQAPSQERVVVDSRSETVAGCCHYRSHVQFLAVDGRLGTFLERLQLSPRLEDRGRERLVERSCVWHLNLGSSRKE